MSTSCILNDYVKRKRASLLFNADNFSPVIQAWENEDQMLLDLQHVQVFKGFTKWNQLEPVHFRLLVTNAINSRDKLVPAEKHFDDTERPVASLYFLIMGLVYCLQRRTGAAIDTMKIFRVSEIDVTFEFTLTIMPEERRKPKQPGLTVVVDNTREDDLS